MRVPGGSGTLLDAKAQGADVRMVYSPLDALRIARENPDREVVFFAVGFETTAPSTALTLKRAKQEGIPNFSCFSNHVTIVPPLRALLESPDLRLDGFIGPGHVSHRRGRAPVRVHPGGLRQADRDLGLRAARPAPVGLHGAPPARRGTVRGREPVRPRRRRGTGIRRRSPSWPRSSSCGRTSSGVASASSRTAGSSSPRRTRTTTPSCASRCRASGSPTRRPASAGRC